MAIEFEKLRQNLDHELVYELNGEEMISFKPKIGSKRKLAQLYAEQGKKKDDTDIQPFVDFIYGMIIETNDDLSADKKELIQNFVSENVGTLLDQTMIGFGMTSKEEMDKLKQKAIDKVLGDSPN